MPLDQLTFEGFHMPVQLDTREKLIGLRDDPHAGFLPFSDIEKTQGTEMLDYLGDRRQYPAGLGNRLQEIYIHQNNLGGPNMARRALFSLAYTYGDYALNAQQQLAALTSLHTDLNESHFNPSVSVAEDFPEGHPGIAPLVRFMDVLSLREDGVQTTAFNPLKVFEKRSTAANNSDDKQHKVIGDRYTATDIPKEVQDRIDSFAEDMRIGQIRTPLSKAIANETVRFSFWTDRIRDTKKHQAAWIIGKQVLARIESGAA